MPGLEAWSLVEQASKPSVTDPSSSDSDNGAPGSLPGTGHIAEFTTAELPDRIAAKIVETPGPMDTPCLRWTGAKDGRGYGNVKVQGRVRKAHRVVYELTKGPVATGLDCDHLCREPSCVRPSHIEPVPHRVNVQRGAARTVPGARQRAKTHCPRGHAYSPENTYIQPSTRGRCCRACDREKKRGRATVSAADHARQKETRRAA
jgi:hypothetical protein